MNQIPHHDWLPEQARWSYLACSGFLAWSRNLDHGSFFGVLSHILNALLAKLVRSRWLDIRLVLFFGLNYVSNAVSLTECVVLMRECLIGVGGWVITRGSWVPKP